MWSSSSWISGKHFFINNSFQQFLKINNLKRKEININNVTMSLSEWYNLILPLNLNVKCLLYLRNIFLYFWEIQLNTFVYLYAKTICLYLDATGINVNQATYTLIRISTNWYHKVVYPFYYFLIIPLKQRKHRGNAKEVIQEIDKLYSCNTIRIEDLIPKCEEAELST